MTRGKMDDPGFITWKQKEYIDLFSGKVPFSLRKELQAQEVILQMTKKEASEYLNKVRSLSKSP
jgi:hypothetical protein